MRARQMLVGQNEVDARRYGIRNSTTSDQTVAFQTMLDDLSYAGGKRILPFGEIHIDGDIDIDTGASIGFWPNYNTAAGISWGQLIGQGVAGTKIVQQGAGGVIRAYNSGATQQHNHLSLSGFSLVGPGLADANIGIQIGGVSVASDILAGSKLYDLRIQNFGTCIALDDATSTLIERVIFEGMNYGIEFGFNVDALKILSCRFGSATIPGALAASTTSASTTVTLTSGSTTDLRVGMRVKGANLPYGTTISSITDATNFEASAAATATGADTLYFFQGIGLSLGRGPFAGIANPTTGSGNAINVESSWFMRLAEGIANDDTTNANLKIDSSYIERCNRIATLGTSAGSTSMNYFCLENCHVSQADLGFKDYAIYENSAAGSTGDIVIRNCRSDSTSPVPWIRLRSASSVIDWSNNILPCSTSRIHVFDSSMSYNPSDKSRWVYGLHGSNAELVTLGVTGSLTPLVPPKADIRLKVGAMTGAVTINAPSMTYGVEGQRIKFTFIEDATAGHAVTWNAAYHFHTAWTNSVVTTDANKRSYVEFEYTGSVWIQVSQANVWVA